jgi:hypothetical protein
MYINHFVQLVYANKNLKSRTIKSPNRTNKKKRKNKQKTLQITKDCFIWFGGTLFINLSPFKTLGKTCGIDLS